jgi:hypothetical protein
MVDHDSYQSACEVSSLLGRGWPDTEFLLFDLPDRGRDPPFATGIAVCENRVDDVECSLGDVSA